MLRGVRDRIWFWSIPMWIQDHYRPRSLWTLLRLNPDPALQGMWAKGKEQMEWPLLWQLWTCLTDLNRSGRLYRNTSFALINSDTSWKSTYFRDVEFREDFGSCRAQWQQHVIDLVTNNLYLELLPQMLQLSSEDWLCKTCHLEIWLLPTQPGQRKSSYGSSCAHINAFIRLYLSFPKVHGLQVHLK